MQENILRILIAENNSQIQNQLSSDLKSNDFIIIKAENYTDSVIVARQQLPDAVLMSTEIINQGKHKVYLTLQQHVCLREIPCIVLANKYNETEHIKVLNSGADDYLIKNINPSLLSIRIKSLIRIKKNTQKKKQFRFNGFLMNPSRHYVSKQDVEINLTKREFEILYYLVENSNVPVSKTEIIDKVVGNGLKFSINTIDAYIRQIKKKMNINNIVSIPVGCFMFKYDTQRN